MVTYCYYMLFHSQEFRQAINDSTSQSITLVLGKLIYSLRNQREQVYLTRMTEEIGAIIKSATQSPILKFKTVKMLMYLIVMGEPQVMQLFGESVYPLIRNACLFNRSHPLLTRGMDFFRNNKYYEIANFEEKNKIKNIGCRYIAFCLECVYMLSQWLPRQSLTNSESIYLSSYQMLVKEGVIFPKPAQLAFFSEERVRKIEKELKNCEKQADKFKQELDHEYFYTDRSRFDAQMMNGVEYLQKKLKEKEKIISEMKLNNSVIDIQKQSYLTKMQEQEVSHIHRVQMYEKKIMQLTQEVRNMKDVVKVQGKKSPEQENMQRQYIAQLQAKLQLYAYQNSQLRDENARKSSIIQGMADKFMMQPSSAIEIVRKQQNQNNIKELLQLDDEPQQYQGRYQKALKKATQKEIFFQYRDIKTIYPFYEYLTKEMQIRFRKSLLKPKQILFKNKQIQIGVISSLKDEIELQMTVIFTNLSQYTLNISNVSYQSCQEQLVKVENILENRKIKVDEQIKQQITVTVNSIDSICPTFTLQYNVQKGQRQTLTLILPIGKIKLLQPMNFTSHPLKQWSKTQRVLPFQKRILSQPSKLKEYIPKCFTQTHAQQQQYCFKLKLLSFTFFARICPIGEESLRISISYKEQNKCLAQKLMDELQFILLK